MTNLTRNRLQHQDEVRGFLQKQFASQSWEFTLPHGYGSESYFAHANGQNYFVKLNAPVRIYLAMASIGLAPPVLALGYLEDGTSLLVQPRIAGRNPTQRDYHVLLGQVAGVINKMHNSPEVQQALSPAISDQSSPLALQALARVRIRWEQYKDQVPAVASLIDEGLATLAEQSHDLQGEGVVASHNDICNANWLLSPDGSIYLIDPDAMSLDDPACDIGAILWWYYPPELRLRFLETCGFVEDKQFEKRMHVRMALHCLHITLPRQNSYDRFDPISFPYALTDFFAVLAGRENPQGYNIGVDR
ncbi:MAG: phosphotransferase [Acidobacteriaceae bacterium]